MRLNALSAAACRSFHPDWFLPSLTPTPIPGDVRNRRGCRLSPLVPVLAALAIAQPLLPLAPAKALEEVVVQLPLVDTGLTIKVNELRSLEALRAGNSDLAELDRASDGAIGRQVWEVLNQPVPLRLTRIVDGSVGSPLLDQAILVLSTIGKVEGRPPDLTGATLREALDKASATGDLTLLNLIKAIPGQRLTLNLTRAKDIANRMLEQRDEAVELLARLPQVVPPSTPLSPGGAVITRTVRIAVAHRKQPLELVVMEPQATGNGHLVLISHGLWDDPKSFAGWGRLLASRGYTVILPRHPGSDSTQQEAVLAGEAPPPTADELALRPLDVKAAIDQVNGLGLTTKVDNQRVVVLGHSWGGTTVLQLAGARPTEANLRRSCNDVRSPDRNLSWTLQCSWVSGVNRASIHDSRVIAVAAVSPPASLLFPRGSGADLNARVLLVSGSRDWVVPPDPEAIDPVRTAARAGHQLVLVNGGDHFNLRPEAQADGGVLGAMLLKWADAAFSAGEGARPREGAAPLLTGGGWGHADFPMVDATRAVQNP
ncbi:MAG: alpha/beta fold hydrolase [Cyanobacteria bacterium K_Offshore_surface_m2_239]|nr:alpha/beta fold hydrolase [Cyanobacteria bacterium K_Offshore_surface_m2_239]